MDHAIRNDGGGCGAQLQLAEACMHAAAHMRLWLRLCLRPPPRTAHPHVPTPPHQHAIPQARKSLQVVAEAPSFIVAWRNARVSVRPVLVLRRLYH